MEKERFILFNTSIAKMNKCLQKLKNNGMNIFGLKGVHTTCLYALSQKNDGMRLNELVKICDMDKSIVSRSLSELVELGYVKAIGDAGKYNTVYFLNENAEPNAEYIRDTIYALQNQLDEGVSEEDLEVFYKVLKKFIHNCEKAITLNKFEENLK